VLSVVKDNLKINYDQIYCIHSSSSSPHELYYNGIEWVIVA